MKQTNNTVLITGGSSGIGLALAKALLHKGNTVIICGRDSAKLERVARDVPGLVAIHCDITNEEDIRQMITRITHEYGELSMLINNAGVATPYDFLQDGEGFQPIEQEVTTNILGTIKVTKLALPLLTKQAEAAIVILSSAVAYVPLSTHPVYSATKSALHSLSQSLRQQVARTSVKVFEVLPPTVDTEGAKSFHGAKLSPDVVVQAVLKGLERNVYDIRVGQVNALYLTNRLSPTLAQRILDTVASKPEQAVRRN